MNPARKPRERTPAGSMEAHHTEPYLRGERDDLRRTSSNTKLSSLSFTLLNDNNLLASKFPECKKEAKVTCTNICRDYCNSTAVHGFRYFFEEKLSIVERIFWVFAVFLSFAGCFYLISKIWIKWDSSPVIVSFAEAPTPVWEIPFPAVTICPSTKTKLALYNFTHAQHRHMDNLSTENEIWKYQALSLICLTEDLPDNPHFNESALHFIRDVAPTFEDVVVDCSFQYKKLQNCSKYFREVVTSDGICFSFNSLGSKVLYRPGTEQALRDIPSREPSGWSFETGYRNDDKTIKEFYPLRQVVAGPYSGLMVVLRSYDRDLDYLCRGCEQGFRVYLHSPEEAPESSQHQLVLPLNASMHLLSKPSLMTTTPGLREYSPERRTCFFPSERHLRFYNMYSQANCISECFANLTLERCGCSHFSAPRFPGTKICGFASRCTMTTYETFLNDTLLTPFDGPIPDECQCLPSCQSLSYEGEGSVNDYPWIMESRARRLNVTEEGISLSRLTVYFDSLQFITSHRSELYGHADFLANSGGLLGLFSGFSVISLVEVLYYVSLRLFCDIKRRSEARRRRQQAANS